MKKRTNQELDQYLNQIEPRVPVSFADVVIHRIQAAETKPVHLQAVKSQPGSTSALRPYFKTIVETGLLLLGGAIGASQALVFIFGVWSVTTVG